MKSFYIEQEIAVHSEKLTKTWLKNTFSFPAEAIAAFVGPITIKVGRVSENHDIEDIQCDKMLHFIIKNKHMSKRELVLHLYYFASLVAEHVGKGAKRERATVICKGIPMSLSAVRYYSDMSLIHLGLFVTGEKFNRPSLGLEALQINEKDFALDVLFDYVKNVKEMKEYQDMVQSGSPRPAKRMIIKKSTSKS